MPMILRDQGPARLSRMPDSSVWHRTVTHLCKGPQQLRDHHLLPTTLKYIIASRALEDNQYVFLLIVNKHEILLSSNIKPYLCHKAGSLTGPYQA